MCVKISTRRESSHVTIDDKYGAVSYRLNTCSRWCSSYIIKQCNLIRAELYLLQDSKMVIKFSSIFTKQKMFWKAYTLLINSVFDLNSMSSKLAVYTQRKPFDMQNRKQAQAIIIRPWTCFLRFLWLAQCYQNIRMSYLKFFLLDL